MAYSDFKLEKVYELFNLNEKIIDLFNGIEPLAGSEWLHKTLSMGLDLALSSASEKARSEFIVVPILFELRMRNNNRFTIYSGENLDVDAQRGLKGECDFILAKGDISYTIKAPIFSLVEAKKHDIGRGLGQCTAQLVGARLFNQKKGNDIETIFGCVTTGTEWKFMKLEGNTLYIDRKLYHIDDLALILAVMQNIIDNYL